MTVNAIAAPESLAEKVQTWKSRQTDLIEGRCGCRMTREACLDRQERYAHKALLGNGNERHEVTRHYFIPCAGKPNKDPCGYYQARERDPQTCHRSFEVGQHRIGADTLETIHKRNRFGRATQGISAKVGT